MVNFATISDEYISVAIAAKNYFRADGYTVSIEKHKIGYPYVPALVAKRRSTTLIIEVGSKLPPERTREWVSYCKSVGNDNRVVFATRETDIEKLDINHFNTSGVGLYAVNGTFHEIFPPRDIAISMEMPSISDFPRKLKIVLGPVYEKVRRNEPIEAFEEACIALETVARPYLWRRVSTGAPPAVLINKNKTISLTRRDIDKMTLGALGVHFNYISQMNHADNILAQTIPSINKDRINVAHKKHQRSSAIRRKAGQNLWAIINALKAMH